MDDPLIGAFTELPFQATRVLVADTVRIGMTRRRIRARATFRAYGDR